MHNRQSRIGGMIPLLHLNVHLWQTSRMGAQPGTRPGTGGVTLTEAAAILGISRDALKKRVQRGAIPAYKDETGTWYVIIPEGDMVGDMSRDMGEGQGTGHLSPTVPAQLSAVMDQWLVPLVRQIAEQGEEIGGLKADLRNERERREVVEHEYAVAKKELAALRLLARTTERKSHEAAEQPPLGHANESLTQTPNVAPAGAEREPEGFPKQRWPWWMRLLAGK